MQGGIDPGEHIFIPPFVVFADIYGDISYPGKTLILPGWRWVRESQVWVSSLHGAVSTRGDHCFRPRFGGVADVGRICDPRMGSYKFEVALALRTPRSQLAISPGGWSFHTVRGSVNPGVSRSRPRFVGVVYIRGFLIRPWVYILPGWRWFMLA